MKSNFESALKAVLHHEGGFVHHKDDPGGMTNLGCTKKVWEEHCGHEVDEKAMRALTPSDVAPLYKRKYWDKINGDELPDGVDYAVFDCSINSGPGRAAKFLQSCAGVEPDGGIGPKTLAAVKAIVPSDLVQDYSKRRLSFMMDLPTWGTFGKGWTRRVNEVEQVALKMIAD
jgi:lysozyme family protein